MLGTILEYAQNIPKNNQGKPGARGEKAARSQTAAFSQHQGNHPARADDARGRNGRRERNCPGGNTAVAVDGTASHGGPWRSAANGSMATPTASASEKKILKSGAQLRPIGAEAVRLIEVRPVRDGFPWIFPASDGDGHFVGLPKVLERICARAGLEGVTVHVLRHSFAATAAEMGFSELTIAGLLGHSVPGITARYAHVPELHWLLLPTACQHAYHPRSTERWRPMSSRCEGQRARNEVVQ